MRSFKLSYGIRIKVYQIENTNDPRNDIYGEVKEYFQTHSSPYVPIGKIHGINNGVYQTKSEIGNTRFCTKENADDSAYCADKVCNRQPRRIIA